MLGGYSKPPFSLSKDYSIATVGNGTRLGNFSISNNTVIVVLQLRCTLLDKHLSR